MFEMNDGLFCGLSKHLLHSNESVTSCIILGKLLYLPGFQFPHL